MQTYMSNPQNYQPLNFTSYQQNLLMQLLQNLQNQQNQGAPMNNGYGFNQGPQPQPSNNAEFVGAFVESFDDVKRYSVPLGGIAVLMDRNNNRLYTKQLNNNGDFVYNHFKFEPDDSIPNNPPSNQSGDNQQQNIPSSNQIEQALNQILTSVKQLQEDHDSFKKKVNEGFGVINQKFEQIEGKNT